jgi:uncharacterized membrane-anchored protein
VVVAAVAALGVVDFTIAAREALVRDGRVVLLDLAPLDPRSLMQGDYMALRYRIADEMFRSGVPPPADDGRVVLRLDPNGVASFRRFDDGTPLTADEARLRYRIRNGLPKFATNAYFFEEGRAQSYANARYGEFRVAPDGEAILTGLRDSGRQPLK